MKSLRIESVVIVCGLAVCALALVHGSLLILGFERIATTYGLNDELRWMQLLSILVLSLLLIEKLHALKLRSHRRSEENQALFRMVSLVSSVVYLLIATACLTQALHFMLGEFRFWYVVLSALTLGLAFVVKEHRAPDSKTA